MFIFTCSVILLYFKQQTWIFNLGQQSFIACIPRAKIRKFIFHYRENISFTVPIPATAFWQHGKNLIHIKKIMIMIKTHFQLEKDVFGFPSLQGLQLANCRMELTMGQGGMRGVSRIPRKSVVGACVQVPLAGCAIICRSRGSAGTRTLARNRTINRKFPRANDFLRVCTPRCAFANGRAHMLHMRDYQQWAEINIPSAFCLLKINGLAASTAFYKTRLKRARR